MPSETSPARFWPTLLILIGAGVAVALQIGKVPAALPFLQDSLNLSLVQSGWVVSIFGLVAAGFAAFIGALADRIGHLRAALCGLVLTAGAALVASRAETGTTLLALRVFEGLGYLLTATALPPLILRFAPDHRRSGALALWALFVPFGSFAMMLISGPVLAIWDWRVLWVLSGLMILSACLPLWLVGRRIPPAPDRPRTGAGPTLRMALRPAPLLGAATFGAYAACYFIITGFLPLTLIGEDGLSPIQGATLGAIVIGFNATGILLAGWLLGRGVRPSRLIVTGGCVLALLGAVVFATGLPVPVRIAAAIAAACAGALVPSSLFAAIPRLAGDPGAVSTMSGMLAQGSGIGQLTGPPLAAALVSSYSDWHAAMPVVLTLALGVAGCGLALRRHT